MDTSEEDKYLSSAVSGLKVTADDNCFYDQIKPCYKHEEVMSTAEQVMQICR